MSEGAPRGSQPRSLMCSNYCHPSSRTTGSFSQRLGTTPWLRRMANSGQTCSRRSCRVCYVGVLEGNANAFSEFMHNESMRVLGEVEVLRLPGWKP